MTRLTRYVLLIVLFSPSYTLAEETINLPHLAMGVYLPGINDELNITDIRVAMDYWVKEITQDMNLFRAHTEFFVDMKDMSQSFNNNQLDVIIAPPLSIVKHFNLNELSNGFVGIRANGLMNSLILLVKNDTEVTGIASLRGKRLLMPLNDELAEVFIDTQTRKFARIGYKQFFKSIEFESKNSRMILDLFFGKADAALVYLRAYDVTQELNPQIKSKTKVLLSYSLRSKDYAFFSKNFGHGDLILNNIVRFTQNPRGRQLLELFKTDDMVEAKKEDLLPIKALYEEYIELKEKY